jgi:hypothetical protein
VILVLVIPNLGNLIAKEILPIPSSAKVSAVKLKNAREIENDALHQGKRVNSWYHGYGSACFEIWPEIRRSSQVLEEEYRVKSAKLTRLSKGITRISPSSSFTFSTMALARTDIKDEQNYEDALFRHIDEFTSIHFAKGQTSPPFWEWLKSRELSFAYEELSLADSLSGAFIDISLLFFYAILFFICSYVSFLRYDPT